MEALRNSVLVVATTAALSLAPAAAQQLQVLNEFPIAPQGSASLAGLDYDPIMDTLWTADPVNDLIQQFDRAGNRLTRATAVVPAGAMTMDPDPRALAIDSMTGHLWIYDELSDRVYGLDNDGTPLPSASTSWPTGAAMRIRGMSYAFDTKTLILVGVRGGSAGVPASVQIVEYNLQGTQQGPPLTLPNLTNALGVAYDYVSERLYVSDGTAAGGLIHEFDRAGNIQTTYTVATAVDLNAFALDAKHGNLLSGNARAIGIAVIGPDVPLEWPAGSVVLTGGGCRDSWGQSHPQTSNGCVRIGRSVGFAYQTCALDSYWVIGFSRLGIPIPATGTPGCVLWQTTDFVSGPRRNPGARTSWELRVPADQALVGNRFYNQAINLPDIGANPFGISMSNGCVITIQQ